ncbi:replication-relaxation family protein [Metabacillus litoralis]|uniref:replication-relaxation family protein n=1 Tax=Metabacillus litoralis TaxID=152268 RepID=UPI00203E4751|nr:replication-relaxation family protein [Metabacillus litoralis]MCM3160972.1 replication-relaxation family protein [Metabacillus litoralis]
MHDLGSARNASRVMQGLSDYVSSFRDGENIYYLNKEGRERVGAKRAMKKTTQARHYLMRNSIYIAYGCPSNWKNEMKFGIKEVKNASLVCDATFVIDRKRYIIEVDHTQKMSKNKSKIERYRKLIELGVFEKMPMFIWMTTTQYRKDQLIQLCEGLEVQIFLVNDFH